MRPLTSREPGAAAARAALVAVMLVVGAATAVLGDSQLIAEVSWKAPGGQTGTVLFQGTGDGGVLRGIVYAGDTQLPVTGTIGADGAVSGTVSFGDGVTERIVGTFSAALDMQRHLRLPWSQWRRFTLTHRQQLLSIRLKCRRLSRNGSSPNRSPRQRDKRIHARHHRLLAPELGGHNDEVLVELGYSPAQIRDFRDREII